MSPRKPKTKSKQCLESFPVKNDVVNNQPAKNNLQPQPAENAKDPGSADTSRSTIVTESNISEPTQSKVEKQENAQKGGSDDPKTAGGENESQETKQEQVAVPAKSKAQMRAERRQIQEAQRAAKATRQQQQQGPQQQQQQRPQRPTQNAVQQPLPRQQPKQQATPTTPTPQEQANTPATQTESINARRERRKKKTGIVVVDHVMSKMFAKRQVPMFRINNELRDEILEVEDIRQSVITYGLKLGYGRITDSWEVMKGLVLILTELIREFEAVDKSCIIKELIDEINIQISYLAACRPLTVGMTNLIKHLKYHIKSFIDRNDLEEDKFKSMLLEVMGKFYKENLVLAQENISHEFSRSLKENEVIVVYGYSRLVLRCLYDAKMSGKSFKVVITHHSSTEQSKRMAETLMAYGIECELGLSRLCSPQSKHMNEATRVVLSTEAAFIDGSLLTESGGLSLVMAASKKCVPVIFLCETFKFSDLNTMDLQTFNVLEDTEDGSLSPFYDVVPLKLECGILTEMGYRSAHSIESIMKKKWISTYMVY